MGLFEPTLSGTIFRRGCCRKTQLCKTKVNAFSGLPKAFVSSAGILNLPITSLPVDNFHDRALWCKSTGINYNMHGWILCRYRATGWFWWISGLRAVTMWSSSSFTKNHSSVLTGALPSELIWTRPPLIQIYDWMCKEIQILNLN